MLSCPTWSDIYSKRHTLIRRQMARSAGDIKKTACPPVSLRGDDYSCVCSSSQIVQNNVALVCVAAVDRFQVDGVGFSPRSDLGSPRKALQRRRIKKPERLPSIWCYPTRFPRYIQCSRKFVCISRVSQGVNNAYKTPRVYTFHLSRASFSFLSSASFSLIFHSALDPVAPWKLHAPKATSEYSSYISLYLCSSLPFLPQYPYNSSPPKSECRVKLRRNTKATLRIFILHLLFHSPFSLTTNPAKRIVPSLPFLTIYSSLSSFCWVLEHRTRA